eukprot:jgi/Orpsp1_1/1181489/evm.model.c7180000077361.1
MFNNKNYIPILIIFLFSSIIYGKQMSLEEVKNIKLEGLDKNNCPDYNNGDFKRLNRCSFDFYCKDDICVSSTVSDHTINFPSNNGTMETFITDICRDGDIRKCQIDKNDCPCKDMKQCTNDNECITNRCFNNYCRGNFETLFIKCQDIGKYNSLTFSYSYSMSCGFLDNDKSSDCEMCASKECYISSRYDKSSECINEESHKGDIISSIVLYLGIIFL